MKKHTAFILLIVAFFIPGRMAAAFTLAIYPFGDEKNIHSAFSTLTDYLSKETGDDFRLVVTRDYNELSKRIIEGTVDFAWIGSANYVKTRKTTSNIVYMATYQEWNSDKSKAHPYYQSVILTLKSSPYTDIESIKGTRFAFTSPDSTSGFAYPRMIFSRLGIVPDEFFKSVFFIGRHSNVINALVAGSIDAGACSDGTYYKALRDHGDIFRVLKYSEPIPLDPIVAVKHVDPKKIQKVQKLLLDIGTEHPVNDRILKYTGWPSAGFVLKSPEFYDTVDEAMRIKNAQ